MQAIAKFSPMHQKAKGKDTGAPAATQTKVKRAQVPALRSCRQIQVLHAAAGGEQLHHVQASQERGGHADVENLLVQIQQSSQSTDDPCYWF